MMMTTEKSVYELRVVVEREVQQQMKEKCVEEFILNG
jgi:hypothetical protein